MVNLRQLMVDMPGDYNNQGDISDEPSPPDTGGRQKVQPVPIFNPGDIPFDPDSGPEPNSQDQMPADSGGTFRRKGEKSKVGETPRERATGAGMGGNEPAFQSTPRQSSVPTPMSGQQSTAPQGVMPFSPMTGPDAASFATPRLRSLYGGSNGLTGGGLGVPLDPVSDQQSDPISQLLKILQQQKPGLI